MIQSLNAKLRHYVGLRSFWGKVGLMMILMGMVSSGRSYGPPIPVCPDCSLPRQPSTSNVYVRSPVSVDRGTVIQRIVFSGSESRHDFPVKVGRKYYFYLLPHAGNPDLGVSSVVMSPFQMPDWQWMPNPGSAYEGAVIVPAVSGFVSVKVRGTGKGFSSYSLAVFER